MKTLAELQAIRDKAREKMTVRDNNEEATRVVVGMATCGIAAGARPVLNAFVDEVAKRHLNNVTVTQTAASACASWSPSWRFLFPARKRSPTPRCPRKRSPVLWRTIWSTAMWSPNTPSAA